MIGRPSGFAATHATCRPSRETANDGDGKIAGPLDGAAESIDSDTGSRAQEGSEGFRVVRANHAAPPIAATAAVRTTHRVGAAARDRAAGTREAPSSRASPISRSRCRESLVRLRRSRSRTNGGTDDGNALQSGSRSRIAAMVSVVVSPPKARRPVSISKSTQPNAQMSVRLSTALPRACSGDM